MYGGEEVRRIQQYSFRMDNLLGKGATGEVYLGSCPTYPRREYQ